jgi:hypothetical protein
VTWRSAISTIRGLNELIRACQQQDVQTLRKCVRWGPGIVTFRHTWPGAGGPSGKVIARRGEGRPLQEELTRWSTSTAEQLSGAWPTKVCATCGSWFVPARRSDQKTCNHACRQKLYRIRKNRQDDQA